MTGNNTYHMSRIAHPIGKILNGNGRPKVSDRVEEALERLRPVNCLSRLHSVYSREVMDFTNLGIDEGYIYELSLRENSSRHDANWIGLLQLAEMKEKYKSKYIRVAEKWPDWTEEFVTTCGSNYWSGTPSEHPLWEILSPEAEVIAQLSNAPIKANETRGGWSGSSGA